MSNNMTYSEIVKKRFNDWTGTKIGVGIIGMMAAYNKPEVAPFITVLALAIMFGRAGLEYASIKKMPNNKPEE